MNKYLAVLSLCACSNLALAEALEAGADYRFKVKSLVYSGCEVLADGQAAGPGDYVYKEDGKQYSCKKRFVAPESAKFEVLSTDVDSHYSIKFLREHADGKPKFQLAGVDYEKIVRGDEYKVPRKSLLDGESVDSKVGRSLGGFTTGVLSVPFKYRTDTDSFAGQANLGAYVGYGFDIKLTNDDWYAITPVISAGYVNVDFNIIDENGESSSESRSGFTWSAGLMFGSWNDDVTFGLMVGQDRIGDDDWESEGETWVSLAVGFKFLD